jgi:hypothetical protein
MPLMAVRRSPSLTAPASEEVRGANGYVVDEYYGVQPGWMF